MLNSAQLRELFTNNFNCLENIKLNEYDLIAGIYNNEKVLFLSLKHGQVFCVNSKIKDEKFEKLFFINYK